MVSKGFQTAEKWVALMAAMKDIEAQDRANQNLVAPEREGMRLLAVERANQKIVAL